MSSVITTDFERWKAQEAALGKPVALNEFVFANVPGLDPSKDISRDEKLPPTGQIVHRQAVNKAGLASENAVAYSVTLGTDVGDFVFNWIGLINKESGTLAMITHAPEQRKIKTVDGVQGNVLTRSFLLEFNGAAKETQITTSAETWQIDFTARLAGMDEMQRLANRDIYGAAAFFGDGFLVTKAAEQYRVTPGTAYIEGLRGTLEEITTFNNLRDTKIYADFTFQGNLVSKWQTFVKITTAKTLAHYQDAAGFQHYVAVIAEIDQNGNITDKRVKGTAIDRELAELKKDLPEKYQPKGDYQPAGSYVTTANFSLELNKKIDKASISDVMGNNGDKVPSLRLLSEQIGKCQPKGDYQPAGDYVKTHPELLDGNKKITDQLFGGLGTGIRAQSPFPPDAPVQSAFKILQIGDDGWPTLIGFDAYQRRIFITTRKSQGGELDTWDELISKKDIPSLPLFGQGQTFQNVINYRTPTTAYTNGDDRAIFIIVSATQGMSGEPVIIKATVDGNEIINYSYGSNSRATVFIPVPEKSWYRIDISGGSGAKIVTWLELKK
ncbi:phage tail-collar fiber domain-containing protein [Morganella morganii]|uniref:phage tail-collar fiber domain-containing protein n=1 Tax=Morganella morganii TaxID=582 RepID=UPI00259EE812|nr:phage tail protein [Morganella morganii]WOZ89095.1 phage tail protein [Morganella morganii]